MAWFKDMEVRNGSSLLEASKQRYEEHVVRSGDTLLRRENGLDGYSFRNDLPIDLVLRTYVASNPDSKECRGHLYFPDLLKLEDSANARILLGRLDSNRLNRDFSALDMWNLLGGDLLSTFGDEGEKFKLDAVPLLTPAERTNNTVWGILSGVGIGAAMGAIATMIHSSITSAEDFPSLFPIYACGGAILSGILGGIVTKRKPDNRSRPSNLTTSQEIFRDCERDFAIYSSYPLEYGTDEVPETIHQEWRKAKRRLNGRVKTLDGIFGTGSNRLPGFYLSAERNSAYEVERALLSSLFDVEEIIHDED